MTVYYNENDLKAAAWLEEVMRAGLIPKGEIDTRSITDVRPNQLSQFTQCHFFAGIGGWAYALRLAGWPEDEEVWTGSCPCQPYSCAGKGLGEDDPRHLWPVWFPLIRERGPAIVLGEQVASKAALEWLDGVFADLEGADYACGAADLCAASVGAPHIRQRLFWVSDRESERWKWPTIRAESGWWYQPASNAVAGRASNTAGRGFGIYGRAPRQGRYADEYEQTGWLPDVQQPGLEGQPGHGDDRREPGREHSPALRPVATGRSAGGVCESNGPGRDERQSSAPAARHGSAIEPAGSTGVGYPDTCGEQEQSAAAKRFHAELGECSAWSHFDILPFRDGKFRRVEAGTFPLAHGVPGRVGLLRGYGNAIVPQKAAEFVKAYRETKRSLR